MIGICGFLRLDGAPAERGRIVPMQRALVRCGTPSFTAHAEGSLAIGAAGWHATIASDAGPALYRHPVTGCVVVADARLQGRDGLARELGLPPASTLTDAQLIAHAWLRHGEDCAERLHGDFAFVVWDPRTRSLFCARDIMGVRPLYLHHAPGQLFAFASSAPALLALRGVPNALNEARIGDFLVSELEGIDQRVTFHQHIERLPPAHQLSLQTGRMREHRYWRLGTEALSGMPRSDAAWADAFSETMEAVVADHLATGAPTGCMLSGGLDSSSLAVIAAAQLRQSGRPPLHTFSSVDTRFDNPETAAVQAMLTLPGVRPHLVEQVTAGGMADRLWQRMWEVEEPYDGIMLVLNAQYLAAGDAGIASVIDGVEGDMLLLGGNGQARLLRQGRLLDAWRNAQGLVSLTGLNFHAWDYFKAALRIAAVPDVLRRWRRARHPDPRPVLPPEALISAEFARSVDITGRLERMQANTARSPHWNRFADARETLEQPYLTAGLERYRRVAAAQGIDALHPLLDRRLLVLCSQLPDHLRMGQGQSKHLLRRMMRGRMPEPVRVRRDKQHLGWAHNQALLAAHRQELGERLRAGSSAIRPYVAPGRLAWAENVLTDPFGQIGPMEWQQVFNMVQLLTLFDRYTSTPKYSN